MDDTHLHHLRSGIQTQNRCIPAESNNLGELANATTDTAMVSTPSVLGTHTATSHTAIMPGEEGYTKQAVLAPRT